MNIFEDLVVELKEENLLEETFIDLPKGGLNGESADDAILSLDEIHISDEPATELEPEQAGTKGISSEPDEAEIELNSATPIAGPGTVESADLQFQGSDETIQIRKAESHREFFKKRAASEMSSLKMVDAVLSAVEREHLKVVPRTYDDLEAKKALHAFMQVAEDDAGDEHKAAEFRLLNETELWCSALAERDRNISVGHLRVYCEMCKPMLSSQAMLSLARFYRNLPYSDRVRGKYDFIMTRLFSKPTGSDRRDLLFTHQQMVGHIKTLYADWSSIPLYATEDDDSSIVLTSLSFEELAVEAESAASFDDLIKSDFFGRLRMFKESIAELYFAPAVTASAVECNVRIGNIYVDLIDRERAKMDVDSIHQRFAELDDQTVSEAAGRSLGLLDILREKVQVVTDEDPVDDDPELPQESSGPQSDYETVEPSGPRETVNAIETVGSRWTTFTDGLKENIRSVNRLFLAGAFVLVAASIGLYVWANYFAEPNLPTAGVKTLSFQGTELGEQVKTAKLSGDTLYLVAQPTFSSLGKDKQTEVLQQFSRAGNDKGWAKVVVMNPDGKTVGFVSATRLDLYEP
ncbi:MAG: hypothetical protein ABJA02_04810, partial [Acidobacteriota bacterium]